MNQIIKYVDALAGSGKTYATITQVLKNSSRGQCSVIVQPSMNLLIQTEKDILTRKSLASVKRIDTVTNAGEVISEIVKYLKQAPEGDILLITHAAFLLVPYWHKKEEWNLYWDETLPTISNETLKVNESIKKVSPLISSFKYTLCDVDDYFIVTSDDDKLLREMANNIYDDANYKIYQSFSQKALSMHYNLYVKVQNYYDMLEGNFNGYINAISVLNSTIFDGFGSVTILSALFTESLMYQIFDTANYIMTPHLEIINKLQYTTHKQPVTFLWAFDMSKGWSKTFYNKRVDGIRIIDKIVNGINRHFDREFVYLKNKDTDVTFNQYGEELPYSAHGLNKWAHVHNFAGVGAYQSSSHFVNMCKSIGVNNIVKNERMEHQYYQCLMRTSIRNPFDFTPKTIIVPTKDIAVNLSRHFDNVIIDKLDMEHIKINDIHDFKEQNKQEIEITKALRNSCLYYSHKKTNAKNKTTWGEMQKVSERLYIYKRIADFLSFTLASNNFKTDCIEVPINDWDELAAIIKKQTRINNKSKQNNYLISPATFDTTLSEDTNYGKVNLLYLTSIWFDVDTDDMQPHLWRRYFGDDIQLIMYNSYSSKKDFLKYRVIIPTTSSLSLREYETVTKYIEYLFQRDGYSGPDKSKLNASSFYYAPCRAKEEGGTFQLRHGTEILNPTELIKRATKHFKDVEQLKQEKLKNMVIKHGPINHVKNYVHLDRLVEDLTEGDRSHTAQIIAGILNKGEYDSNDKLKYYMLLQQKGVKDGALKSFKKYISM